MNAIDCPFCHKDLSQTLDEHWYAECCASFSAYLHNFEPRKIIPSLHCDIIFYPFLISFDDKDHNIKVYQYVNYQYSTIETIHPANYQLFLDYIIKFNNLKAFL